MRDMSVNLKFSRTVSVDYEDCRTTEVYDKTFREGQVLRNVALEELSRNFANIHFENGDLAMSVPRDAYKIV